jgi:hypothetical protein
LRFPDPAHFTARFAGKIPLTKIDGMPDARLPGDRARLCDRVRRDAPLHEGDGVRPTETAPKSVGAAMRADVNPSADPSRQSLSSLGRLR